MVQLEERDTQTKVKHEILQEYMAKWGGIITNGLKGHYARNPQYRSQFKARFLYIDYFSYTGVYKEDGGLVYGSPVIGIEALDKIKQFFINQTDGLSPVTTAILFEEVTETYNELIRTLESLGYGERIKSLDQISSLGDGDILVINADSSQYTDRILAFIDRFNPTFSFHFVDPYGLKGIARENLEKIVSGPRADCIINMMLSYVYRFMYVGTKPEDELNATEQAYVRFFDGYFGSSIWREIAHKAASGSIKKEQAEQLLIDAFDKILRGADKDVSVKQIPLKFQDRDQIIYHLFLTTHDATGAVTMNEVLADAHIREYDYRVEKREFKSDEVQTTFNFFGQLPDVKRPTEPQVDLELLANQLHTIAKKRTLPFKDILREMVNSPYFIDDIKDALMKLKEQKRASFQETRSKIVNKSEIKFV